VNASPDAKRTHNPMIDTLFFFVCFVIFVVQLSFLS